MHGKVKDDSGRDHIVNCCCDDLRKQMDNTEGYFIIDIENDTIEGPYTRSECMEMTKSCKRLDSRVFIFKGLRIVRLLEQVSRFLDIKNYSE